MLKKTQEMEGINTISVLPQGGIDGKKYVLSPMKNDDVSILMQNY